MADIAKLIYKKNTLYWGWAEASNVKAFPLSGTWSSASVLAEAQAIYDWYLAGNTPIIVYDSKNYFVWRDMFNQLAFVSPYKFHTEVSGSSWWYTTDKQYRITIAYTWTSVTSVSAGTDLNTCNYLDALTNYQTVYTPLYDGSPATKKYVDDMVWDIETLLSNI